MAERAYWEVHAINPIEARKQIVLTYLRLGSISATARLWRTSQQVVRKGVSRYLAEGEAGLRDRSRRPQRSPRQTPAEIERIVLAARRETGLGRRRLALYLQGRGVTLSPHTIRPILRRHGLRPQRRRRQSVYPALWAWETISGNSIRGILRGGRAFIPSCGSGKSGDPSLSSRPM